MGIDTGFVEVNSQILIGCTENGQTRQAPEIKIESLGVLEQVVLCKLGTDAVGLIPKLGRYLKSSVLVPFSPKKIVAVLGSQSF